MSALVTIEKFGAFYNEGARGMRGGAAQNDKVWGIARINNITVTFWGRRGGTMRFKTHIGAKGKLDALAKWAEKTGRSNSRDVYFEVREGQMRESLAPRLEQALEHYFYSAMSLGKLNTNH